MTWAAIVAYAALVFEILNKPLLVAGLQLLVGGLIAWIFTERWQRWRQRRDFQYAALVSFARSSTEVFATLYELLLAKSQMAPQQERDKLQREYTAKLAPLLAVDADFFAAFHDSALVYDFERLAKLMDLVHNTAVGSPPVDVDKAKKILRSAAGSGGGRRAARPGPR